MKRKTRRIFYAFIDEMEAKLEKHNHKHPDETTGDKMLAALKAEIDELFAARALKEEGHVMPIKGICANIANFAMFIAYHDDELL